MDLVDGVLKGSGRDIAKLISMCEDNPQQARDVLKKLSNHKSSSYVIGITGSPGTGKSTLIYSIAKEFRKRGNSVGIILVDPSSIFTGGALLGDRIRMQELSEDSDIYIRSMGSRGSRGGLNVAIGDVINILDASGKDVIIVETVGAGQNEVDVRMFVHSTVLLISPGSGDDIQALKAGIMEIADIFVVNKSDKEGADDTVREISASIEMVKSAGQNESWRRPVMKTRADKPEGIEQLLSAIDDHKKFLVDGGMLEDIKLKASYAHLMGILSQDFSTMIDKELKKSGFKESFGQIIKKKDIYTIAEELSNKYIGRF